LSEFTYINKYFAPLTQNYESFGLTDDAAIVTIENNNKLVLTKDAMTAGVHFFPDDNPYNLAQKLLRTNLSDLAAMGAKPLYYMLALILPKKTTEKWISEFCQGLKHDQNEFAITLLGGDTVSHDGALSMSLTAFGTIEGNDRLLRSGAKIGDNIYVSGTIGDSALGLEVIQKNIKNYQDLRNRYFIPNPRVELGQKLLGIASSCMDISDGLVQDLGHICSASKSGAEIYQDRIPLSDGARRFLGQHPKLSNRVLSGGDDYELLFTVAKNNAHLLENLSDIPVTKIGIITEGAQLVTLDRNKCVIQLGKGGYSHFS
jgi:thiamine-monophosphate kinase